MTNVSVQKDNYIIQFDGIRLIAIVSVMIAHWLQWQWKNPVMLATPFVHGVTLFFVLSGFLITRILLNDKLNFEAESKNKSGAIKRFYIRRTLRIFPVYYLTILFLLLINYQNTKQFIAWLLSYTTNIYQAWHNVYIGNFNHIWSLCVEEQFYLIWPFVILFTGTKHLLKVIISALVFSLICRYIAFYYFGKYLMVSYSMPCCLGSLGMGALMAYLYIFKPGVSKKLAENKFLFPGSIIFYVLFVVVTEKFDITFNKVVIDNIAFSAVAFLGIIKASQNNFTGVFKYFLENKYVMYLGKISYGMYLFHLFIPDLLIYFKFDFGSSVSSKYLAAIVYFLCTALIAHISWKLIETPFNNLKYKLGNWEIGK